ncbi:Cytochrome c oxidase subunit 6 [Coemansia sp. RSA 2705]|nr:Cytochrome c oxidase subunit 6 [Coemansia sp. RSA 2705]
MFGIRAAIKNAAVARVAFAQRAPSALVARRYYSDHEETYEEFTNRYVKFFENVDEQFELQRGLNNCFAYDLVPDVAICEAALRAARRIDDYATAVRVFEALKIKVDKPSQYEDYLQALKPVMDELVCAKSDYPSSKYGQGGWRIVTGAEERYMQTPPSTAQTYVVSNVQIDECSNFAIIQIQGSMSFGGQLMPMFISSHPVSNGATLYTFKTSDPAGDSFLSLTQGMATDCEQFLPGYSDHNFMCTQPVLGQAVTEDYLGGDPIIGFSEQPDGPLAVLVGVTGLYYSTQADAQSAAANDATAYRFNALAASHVQDIATLAAVNPQSLVSTGDLG